MLKLKSPKNCMKCPLKQGLTRHCGKVVCNALRSSSGTNAIKIPDENCLLKGVTVPERLMIVMKECGML